MAGSVDERLSQIGQWRAPAFQDLLDALIAQCGQVYVVGGNIRDYLLGSTEVLRDLDLVMAGPVLAVARQVADQLGWAYYALDQQRDVARLVQMDGDNGRLVCDIAALRGDLASDLKSRDFTLNSLALRLTADAPPQLIDICGGLDDLRQRRLRPSANENLDQDPLRMLRAVRFAGKMGLQLEANVQAQIQCRAASIQNVSSERIGDELWKIVLLSQPGHAVRMVANLKMLRHVLPELANTIGIEQSLPHHLDVYEHTLQVMNNVAALRDWLLGKQSHVDTSIHEVLVNWSGVLRSHFAETLSSGHSRADWLVWHALFHDVGKPATRTEQTCEGNGEIHYRFIGHESISSTLAEERLTKLRFSRREVQLSKGVIADHMRPHNLHSSFRGKTISRRAAFRFFHDSNSSLTKERIGVDVLLLALADRQAIGCERGEDWDDFLRHIDQLLEFGFHALSRSIKPVVDGHRLIATFNLEPGPLIGHLLAQIMEAQATGEVMTRADAFTLVARLLEDKHTDDPK